MDLVLGVPATIVLTPVIAATVLLVLLTSGWPPIIRQTRVGARERPIEIWKLRTMRRDMPTLSKAELVRSGLSSTADAYTILGPWMRRFSIDEFPQIYQVVTGRMSMVGPRPALPTQHDLLALRRRHGVTVLKPGLTGLAQISGRESLTLATKVRFEALYQRHASVVCDLKIIGRTVRALLERRGAF